MAINFPNNPLVNDTITIDANTWIWDGTKWGVKPIVSPSFVNIVASGIITGTLIGNTAGTHTGPVIGNVTGNITGNVTGNTAGTHTGAVVGNVTGNLTGNVTGDVTGKINNLTITPTTGGTIDIQNSSTLVVTGNYGLHLAATGDADISFPSGVHTLAQTDNPVFTGTTTLNTIAYTWPSANPGTAGFALVNNTLGSLSWANVTPIVTDDIATNTSFYPMFTSATTGNLSATIKTSSSKLYYNPNSGTLTSTIFTASSDERLKENIKPVTNALNKVLALQGVNFNRIGSSELELGLIAQHVEKIIPEVVYTNETGIKSLAYPNLVALLIEAIKEQNTKIEEILRMAK